MAFHLEMMQKIGHFAKWCICDIYHLCQHRENGAISVYIAMLLWFVNYFLELVWLCVISCDGRLLCPQVKFKREVMSKPSWASYWLSYS